jgi:hypothetical protein
MHTKKVVQLVVFIGFFIILAVFTFGRTIDAVAYPNNRVDNNLRVGSDHPKFVNYQDGPSYDSGWHNLGIRPDPIAVEFVHNLGGNPDDYLVSLECRDDTTLGTYDCTDQGFNVNVHWYGLTSTRLQVYAVGGSLPDAVRVRIYKDLPVYDSGWDALGIRPDPIAVEFVHNLGGSPNIYLVSLECRDDTTLGTYDCTDQNFNVNAHWYGLSDSLIQVYATSGSRPDDIRVRIYTGAPAYDSSWRYLGVRPDPIPVQFIHNLNGNPDDYQVDLECWDDTSLGLYDCKGQGFSTDAHWFGLNGTNVQVYAIGGSRPDYVRVRIWRVNSIYMPVVLLGP